jgi:hypothetical protein
LPIEEGKKGQKQNSTRKGTAKKFYTGEYDKDERKAHTTSRSLQNSHLAWKK